VIVHYTIEAEGFLILFCLYIYFQFFCHIHQYSKLFLSISGNISGVRSANGAILLILALGVAFVASPASLPLVIITMGRAHAILIDELMTTSAPIALVIASIAQPETEMLVQMNEAFLG
jgi:hypothetical protein